MLTIHSIQPSQPQSGPNAPDVRATEARENRVPVDQESAAVLEAVKANRQIVFGERTVEFSFDKDVNRVVVRVRSNDTDEIVRQIPPEEYLRMVSQFRELFGVVFDEVA